jgi:hypothetical protein
MPTVYRATLAKQYKPAPFANDTAMRLPSTVATIRAISAPKKSRVRIGKAAATVGVPGDGLLMTTAEAETKTARGPNDTRYWESVVRTNAAMVNRKVSRSDTWALSPRIPITVGMRSTIRSTLESSPNRKWRS